MEYNEASPSPMSPTEFVCNHNLPTSPLRQDSSGNAGAQSSSLSDSSSGKWQVPFPLYAIGALREDVVQESETNSLSGALQEDRIPRLAGPHLEVLAEVRGSGDMASPGIPMGQLID